MEHQALVAVGACNLRCQYCWYETGVLDYVRTTVTPANLSRWLDECRKLYTVNYLTITGGEPMLRRDFGELLDVGVQHRLQVAVLTNGTRITDQWARTFREKDIAVFISLDSLTPDYHNTVRGQHDEVMRGIRLLADADVPERYLTTVVSRGNLDQMEPLLDFAEQHGFTINFHVAALPDDHPLSLRRCTEDELRVFYRTLNKWSDRNGRKYIVGQYGAVIRFGRPIPLNTCPFALSTLVIDSDGSLFPCYQHKGEPLGSMFTSTPEEVQARKRAFIERVRPASCISTDCLGVF